MLGNLALYKTGNNRMRKLIQHSTLIDILESLEILSDIEIKLHETDDFRELEYISLSPIHKLNPDEIAIQLEGQSITYWDKYKIVEIKAITSDEC